MKRKFYLLTLLCWLASLVSAQAQQTDSCNAAFNYAIGGSYSVTFYPADSLAGPQTVSQWYFGDGSSATGQIITHSYSAPGTYTVSHIVTDSAIHCSDSSAQTITIADTVRCFLGGVSFGYMTDSSRPRTFRFVPNPNDSSYHYYWSFGDGSASTLRTPSHTYAQASVYQVSLTITSTSPSIGSDTCRATTTQSVTVGSQPVTCSVSYSYSVDSANAKTISFTAYPVPDSAVIQYWVFTNTPDSINLIANNPTYTFADTGTYNVALRTVSAGGCTAFANGVIHVGNGVITVPPDSTVTIPPDSTGHGDSTITIPPDSTGHGDSTITIPPDSTGHGDSTACADSTGHKDTTQAVRLVVYPNPVSSTLTLNVTLQTAAPVSITLYSTLGSVVGQIQSSGVQGVNQFSIPVQSLPHGIYFVYLRSGGATSQSRFQKQ